MKNTTRAKPAKPNRRGAESLVRALGELESMIRDGARPEERFTVRTVELPDEPKEYTPARVRALRDSMHVSQPVFANIVGASTVLVQSWEQGKRKPNRMARRLLEEIERDPSRWMAKLRRGSAA